MKNIPTPRTAQLRAESVGFYSCPTVPASLCAEIEAEAGQLRAENERLRAALTSFIETWDALPDECRRAANGATNFGRLITTLRAALLGKEGA